MARFMRLISPPYNTDNPLGVARGANLPEGTVVSMQEGAIKLISPDLVGLHTATVRVRDQLKGGGASHYEIIESD